MEEVDTEGWGYNSNDNTQAYFLLHCLFNINKWDARSNRQYIDWVHQCFAEISKRIHETNGFNIDIDEVIKPWKS